ncbi:MAG: DnaJ domain-containing protein [Sneathiellales bacterium]|nr:DnaJ domain-containing protein [Sneathiellales bacterium]
MTKYDFKRSSSDDKPKTRICDHEGCDQIGEFRAPKSRMLDRGSTNDYYWFCLTHIREYNKSWNFFDGMSDNEILKYKDEDITGHRPTWKLGSRSGGPRPEYKYDDPFDFQRETGQQYERSSGSRQNSHADHDSVDSTTRDAYALLNLEPGCGLKDIKRRHKELAKKYHPDIRGGDKQAEEILKNINQAYTHLLSCGNS